MAEQYLRIDLSRYGESLNACLCPQMYRNILYFQSSILHVTGKTVTRQCDSKGTAITSNSSSEISVMSHDLRYESRSDGPLKCLGYSSVTSDKCQYKFTLN
jgi:hypothetical protein